MTTLALWLASLSRFVPSLAYVVAVVIIGVLVAQRSSPSPPVATQDLKRNQQLVRGDLETSASKALVGQYLRHEAKKGKPITPDMVASGPLPGRFKNTMAAIITMPRATRDARNINIGSQGQICRYGKAFGVATEVIDIDCDAQSCSIIVGLPKMPTQMIDPDLLIDADFIAAPQPLSCPGPSP
jgi:hypothetical protein